MSDSRLSRRYLESAAHELHTPLTAILGYQELLAEGIYGELDPGAADAVTRIGRAGTQLMQLIDGLLDVLFLESESLRLEAVDVEIGPLLEEVIGEARGAAQERGADFPAEVPPGLPVVRTDPERLRRVIALALLAAFRASSGATMPIEVRDERPVRVLVRGSSLSPGVLEPELDREPGSDRLSLRLAVARRVMHGLGGSLELAAETDGTVTIEMTLPDGAARIPTV